VLEAIRQRLKKRKSAYSSVFSCAQALAEAKPQTDVVAALLGEPDEDPNDLAALDAAWEEEEVIFGPGAAAAAQCGKDDIAAKVRAARRPAPGMPVVESKRPVVTYRRTNRA
jgi:nitrate reductase delta subunit